MDEYVYGTVASFSLVIKSNDLDFDEITKNLNLKPTKLMRKGEIISKVVGEVKNDIWIFEIKSEVNSEPNKVFELFLSKFEKSKDFIKQLSESVDLCLKCYIQSDYAQIEFEFSPKVIEKLSELNLRLEISILSWGGVEEE